MAKIVPWTWNSESELRKQKFQGPKLKRFLSSALWCIPQCKYSHTQHTQHTHITCTSHICTHTSHIHHTCSPHTHTHTHASACTPGEPGTCSEQLINVTYFWNAVTFSFCQINQIIFARCYETWKRNVNYLSAFREIALQQVKKIYTRRTILNKQWESTELWFRIDHIDRLQKKCIIH